MSSSLGELTERLTAFRDERDWRRFHSLRSLIVSVGIEAGELLELAQWTDDEAFEAKISDEEFLGRLSDEVADVLIYLLLICERSGIDPIEAVARKIDRNAVKYPVDKARGNARKYTEL